jgi:Holliday junction resolvasome RuvABC DNA-binding subunit
VIDLEKKGRVEVLAKIILEETRDLSSLARSSTWVASLATALEQLGFDEHQAREAILTMKMRITETINRKEKAQ